MMAILVFIVRDPHKALHPSPLPMGEGIKENP
jgi:hypothetical protein